MRCLAPLAAFLASFNSIFVESPQTQWENIAEDASRNEMIDNTSFEIWKSKKKRKE